MRTRRLLAAACLATAVGFAALVALRWGGAVARLDPGDAIAAMARRYAEEVPGGRAAACSARPGAGRVWIVVSCGAAGTAERRTYRLDRWGRLLGREEGV